MKAHEFNYRWTLKDANFTKDKGKVFSCFACGGGSTMGYKLAGFDVIGCNEIDHRMMYAYCQNHNPKFPFLEPIQTFKDRTDLPPRSRIERTCRPNCTTLMCWTGRPLVPRFRSPEAVKKHGAR